MEQQPTSATWGAKRPRSFGRRSESVAISAGARGVLLPADDNIPVESNRSPSPAERRQTGRRQATVDAGGFLMAQNERHREHIHAEDSNFRKQIKTLKRKLGGVVKLCADHGLEVPNRFLLQSGAAKGAAKKRSKNYVTTFASDTPPGSQHSGDSEGIMQCAAADLLLHASGVVQPAAIGYDWGGEVEAAEGEQPACDANHVTVKPLVASNLPHQNAEDDEEDDMFIYSSPPPPAASLAEDGHQEATLAPTPAPASSPPPPTPPPPPPASPRAQPPPPQEQCQKSHRTHVDEGRDALFKMMAVPEGGASKSWLKTQRRHLRTLLTAMYGAAWLGTSGRMDGIVERAVVIQPKIEGFEPRVGKRLATSEDVMQVLASVIQSIPGMWSALKSAANIRTGPATSIPDDDDEPKCRCCARAAAEAESDTVDAIKAHMDTISVPLYSLLNLTERRYQDLIDY